MTLYLFLGQRRQSSGSAFGSPPLVGPSLGFRAQLGGVLFELLPAQVLGGFVACEGLGTQMAGQVPRQGPVRACLCPPHHSGGNGIAVIVG